MSDDAHDEATETTEAAEAAEIAQAVADEVAEGSPVTEATVESDVADATHEAPAAEAKAPAVEEAPAAKEPVAEAEGPTLEEAPAEPVAAAEPVEAGAPTDESVAEAAPEEAPTGVSEAFGPVRVARVYVCERGHRTTTLWGEPDLCQAQPLRHGPACGLTLYHITELPEQVQKALNPLKASKKASKKK
jgi:hypothetical protein